MKLRSLVLTFAAVLALGNVALAQDSTLKIGIAQETSSLYPNWLVSTPNQQIATHIFEPLARMDVNNIPQPALAESWQAIDDTTWEFKLRHGVTFHDGSPFTADNVIATFDHAKTVEGTGSTSGAYIRDHAYEKVDDYTIRITTKAARPLLPAELSVLYIYKEGAPTDDFNSGKAAIGTGAYKFVEWVQGSHLTLARNDNYWGDKPEWQTVEFRPITSDPTRIAALLNGDVDVIDRVATADVNRLKDTQGIRVVSRAGERAVYLQPDVSRDISPYVTDAAGQPINNPLRDVRVRKAMSMAINREAIVSRIMDNQAVASGQIATPGMFGHNPDLLPIAFDLDGAKALLAQAGYGDGFALTLHGPSDRLINGVQVMEAVAQMWTRLGIATRVESVPSSTYFSRKGAGGERGTPEFSISLDGFGTATGETMSQHWMLLHTTNRELALGHANYGRYSNIRIDSLLDEAMKTVDSAQREAMLHEIGKMYMDDVALIPLHWQMNVWGMRDDLTLDVPSRMIT